MPGSMTHAAERAICFKTTRGPKGTIDGPKIGDRQILSAWLDRAEALGVDAVLNLGGRPWNIAGVGAIFGVFETRHNQASWLIMRYGQSWILARCRDNVISGLSASLPEILRLIEVELKRQTLIV
jgi:hypothetical protein